MKIYLGTILESLLATTDTTDAAVVVVVVDEEGEGVPLKNSNSALRRTISSVIKAIPLRDFLASVRRLSACFFSWSLYISSRTLFLPTNSLCTRINR